MFARLFFCTTSCLGAADAQLSELFVAAFDVADSFIVTKDGDVRKKLDGIKGELDNVQRELADVQNTLATISDEVQNLGDEVIHEMHLIELDKPYATIKRYDTEVQTTVTAVGRDELAHNIWRDVPDARELLLKALNGDCPSCQGQTIIERELAASGGVPVAFAQSMIRTLTTSQYLVSWALERLERVEDRDGDKKAYEPQYNDMWAKNEKRAFYMMGGCQWDRSMKLTCTSATHQATKTFRFSNGTAVPAEMLSGSGQTLSIPTFGSDHPDWTFDVSCEQHGYPVGMRGDTNKPSFHRVRYVAGFQLHCSDNSDSSETGHHKTDGGSVGFDFKSTTPLRRMSGCTNHPDAHHIMYWASGVDMWTASGEKHTLGPAGSAGGCSDGQGVQYDLQCGTGTVMQRFSGLLDVPSGHSIPYIAKMDITCVPYITGPPQGAVVLV